MIKKWFIIFWIFGLIVPDTEVNSAPVVDGKKILTKLAQIAPPIIQNQGQLSQDEVKYYVTSPGKSVYFTKDGITMDLFKIEELKADPQSKDRNEYSRETKRGVIVKLTFEGSKKAIIKGEDPRATRIHYLIGNDSNKWRKGINTYREVVYEGIYPGIDLRYKSTTGQLKYQFEVSEGADPGVISISIAGIDGLILDDTGNLIIKTAMGDMQDIKPYTYQEINGKKVEIASGFQITGNSQYSFKLGSYNKDYPLIIDPGIAWSTFLGGELADRGLGVVVDIEGNVIVTGYTYSATDFPIANGLYPSYQLNKDVFVTKFTPDGSTFVYSTYLGGAGSEEAHDIAVDRSGNIYLSGYTNSASFSAGTTRIGSGGMWDVFIAKLSPDGSELIYSTFLGDGQNEQGHTLEIDGAGNAYVTGYTESLTFPSGANHTQFGPRGSRDVFLAKLSPDGSTLLYSASFGGTGDDDSHDLVINTDGNIFVIGHASTADFPTTTGPAYAGNEDVFVLKLNVAGDAIDYSRFLGGTGDEEGHGLGIDAAGNAFITGYTTDASFLTGANRLGPGGGSFDAFVVKLSPDGSSILFSTILGGSDEEMGHDLAVDGVGYIYIVGDTLSGDFPVSADAFDTTHGGNSQKDTYITKLSPDGANIIYSTFIGGSALDEAHDIALDNSGNVYITGWTSSASDFPLTAGIPDNTFGGTTEAFVMKFRLNEPLPLFYSTFIGGYGSDESNAIAVDRHGNIYITGGSTSANFPTTPGAYDTQLGENDSGRDVFISKLNADASELIYSTFIGGRKPEYISHFSKAIAVDESENVFVAGRTNSDDFPVTPGAHDSILGTGGNGQDAFIAKLSADGSTLLYCTYLGGQKYDQANALAVDKDGNIFVTGTANSTTTFPPTTGPLNNGQDVFVAKLVPDDTVGADLIYLRFLGGSENEEGHAIVVDYDDNAYITGDTFSITGSTTVFPTTAGAFKTVTTGTPGVDAEVFISKLAPDGTLLYSTFLGGGAGLDDGYGIAIDTNRDIYVAGITLSSDFPTTPSAFDTSYNGGMHDSFIAKLSPDGNGVNDLIYSTFLGGSGHDHVHDIFVNTYGEAYVTGGTSSTDFPVTTLAYQTVHGGGETDIFIAKLSQNGDRLIYSTYFGGSRDEEGCSIVVDNAGSIYVTGKTGSNTGMDLSDNDFPTTSGVLQPTYGGGIYDGFLLKIGITSGFLFSSESGYDDLYALNPKTGTTATPFVYKIVYQDPANSSLTANGYVRVFIDGAGYDMIADTGSGCGVFCDGDYANGEQFYFSTFLGLGTHDYYFEAYNDGLGIVRYPNAGVINGPAGPTHNPLPEVTVEFSGVISSGTTTALNSDTGEPPSDYSTGSDAFYDISTTANYTDSEITVTISYTDSQVPVNENNLKLFHDGGSGWVDITTSLDITNNTITGKPTSLSPFVLVTNPDRVATAVSLLYFETTHLEDGVSVQWATAAEFDNEGFNMLRSDSPNGVFIKINSRLIPSSGGIRDNSYQFTDTTADPDKNYYYKLVDINTSGESTSSYLVAYIGKEVNVVKAALSNKEIPNGTASNLSLDLTGQEILIKPAPAFYLFSMEDKLRETLEIHEDPPRQTLLSFTISRRNTDDTLIKWSIKDDNITGFNLLKSNEEEGEYQQINNTLIEPIGEAKGQMSKYSYVDKKSSSEYYRLEIIRSDRNEVIGPVSLLFELNAKMD